MRSRAAATTAVFATVPSADGIPLSYSVQGDEGPTLILIHGWCCRQAFWRYHLEPLAAHFRVVTLDLVGHGGSRATGGARTWSMQAFAEDVACVAEAIGAESFALVGHSMGGAVAVEAALRLAPCCRFILGVDTFADAAFYRARPLDEIAARRRVFEQDFAATMRDMVKRITSERADPAIVSEIAAYMVANDEDVSLPVLEALLTWDIEARWPLLPCPVETINSAWLARGSEQIALAGLKVHAMAGVGHFPMLESPAAFNALALEVLTRRLLA